MNRAAHYKGIIELRKNIAEIRASHSGNNKFDPSPQREALQLGKKLANALTGSFKFQKFRGGRVCLLEKFRLSSYESAQFHADLGFVVVHNSPQAKSKEYSGDRFTLVSGWNSLSRPRAN